MTFRGSQVKRQLARGGWRSVARLVVLIAVTGASLTAWHWRAALDPVTIAATIGDYPAAPLAFVAAHILASLFFLPRTVLAVAAGLLFGMGWGIVWAALGSALGAVAGFWLARSVNGGLVDIDRLAGFAPVLDRIERGGWRAVAIVRLVPVIPHSLTNYGLGLTTIPLRSYAFGSLLGQLPLTVACVDLGAAGERLVVGDAGWLAPTVIGAAALGLSLLLPALARRRAG
jgi:uncharacterized membrane protein YdjX (TVP38/TMEM64 family)